MGEINLEQISNFIILIGGICIAISNIFKFLTPLQTRAEKQQEARLKKILQDTLPQYMESYITEQQKQLNVVSKNIKELATSIDKQSEEIELLKNSSKDILRQKLLAIYHKGAKTHSLGIVDKEMFDELWKDYEAIGGNGFMVKYKDRVNSWFIDKDNDDIIFIMNIIWIEGVFLMEFNEEQLKVINTTAKKVLVKSGAGAGKSSTIVARVKELLNRGYEPSKIVVLSFTNAAADHIKQLIGNPKVITATAHSFANRLLLKNGVDTSKVIAEERFDDLFIMVRNHKIQEDIQVLIIDECQDSTMIQFIFFNYLKPKEFMYFFDVKQSIFRWSGAKPEYLIELEREKDITTYSFTKNYRCAASILEFARGISRMAGPDYFDNSRAMNKHKGVVLSQPMSIENIIESLKQEPENTYKDWFILVRTNAILNDVYYALNKAKIQCVKFNEQKVDSYDQLQEGLQFPGIKLMTIHAAKGLQSPNVIVIGARFFSLEEKCISYVAATRAINKLIWCQEKKTRSKRRHDGFEDWD